jgi:predicted RNA-binding protein
MYKPKAENVKKLEAFLSEIKRNIKDKELSKMVGDEHK